MKSDKLKESIISGAYIIENDNNSVAKTFAEKMRKFMHYDGHNYVYLNDNVVKIVVE